jgi:hypothetical protein
VVAVVLVLLAVQEPLALLGLVVTAVQVLILLSVAHLPLMRVAVEHQVASSTVLPLAVLVVLVVLVVVVTLVLTELQTLVVVLALLWLWVQDLVVVQGL